ncbi:MAG: hypothetical protein RIF32_08420, partial [Leptospirales bacterium]
MFWSAIFALLSGLPGSGGPAAEPFHGKPTGFDSVDAAAIIVPAGVGATAVGRPLASVNAVLALPSDIRTLPDFAVAARSPQRDP